MYLDETTSTLKKVNDAEFVHNFYKLTPSQRDERLNAMRDKLGTLSDLPLQRFNLYLWTVLACLRGYDPATVTTANLTQEDGRYHARQIANVVKVQYRDARLGRTSGDLFTPNCSDSFAKSILLAKHFPRCMNMCLSLQHLELGEHNVMHVEPFNEEPLPLSEYAYELFDQQPIHCWNCFCEAFDTSNLRFPTTFDESNMFVYVRNAAELVYVFDNRVATSFRTLARLVGERDQWSRAIGFDVASPPVRSEPTPLIDFEWKNLVVCPDPPHPPLKACDVVAPINCTNVNLQAHQHHTILWMIMHAEVPLWRFVGFRTNGRRFVLRDVRKDLYGGIIASAPRTGRTLSVLVYAAIASTKGRTVVVISSKANVKKWQTQQENFVTIPGACVVAAGSKLPQKFDEVVLDMNDVTKQELNAMRHVSCNCLWIICPEPRPRAFLWNLLLGLKVPKSLEEFFIQQMVLCFGHDCLKRVTNVEVHTVNHTIWQDIRCRQKNFLQLVNQFNARKMMAALLEHKVPPADAVRKAPKQKTNCFHVVPNETSCCVCSCANTYVLTCRHSLCEKCLAKVETCPLCRIQISLYTRPFELVAPTMARIAANYILKHRNRRWLVIGNFDVAQELSKHATVLMVGKDDNERVSRHTGEEIVVWPKEPDSVYLGAFTDVFFCIFRKPMYISVGTPQVRVHYAFFQGSFNHFCYQQDIENPKMPDIRKWAKEEMKI